MANKELKATIDRLTAENTLLKSLLKPPKKERFYTYKEAAAMLRISVEGLKSRIKRGQMNRICNNNRPLIALSEIMRFLQEQNPDGIGAFLRFKLYVWKYLINCFVQRQLIL